MYSSCLPTASLCLFEHIFLPRTNKGARRATYATFQQTPLYFAISELFCVAGSVAPDLSIPGPDWRILDTRSWLQDLATSSWLRHRGYAGPLLSAPGGQSLIPRPWISDPGCQTLRDQMSQKARQRPPAPPRRGLASQAR